MKRISLVLLVINLTLTGYCQAIEDTVLSRLIPAAPVDKDLLVRKISDPINLPGNVRSYPYNKARITKVAIGNIVGYGGTMAGLYATWYSKYPQSSFHFFNDNREWLQMDKVGHLYSAYIESYGSMEMWRWTGISRKKRIWIAGLSSAAYQTLIETLDGFSAEWGWSWGDFAANIGGSGLLVGQELAWNEQRIRMKFSFHNKSYGSPQLDDRADDLFGKNKAERFIKDYNGQTYWMSANLKSFMPNSNLPPWLNVAVGYGAEGMFGGEKNIAKDDNGIIVFDRRDIKRRRQWFLAPDVDFNRIKTRSRPLRFVFVVLNAFKFPTPSLEVSNGKVRVNLIHF